MKTLREIWDEASSSLELYRHPDMTEFREAIEPVLEALKEGSIKRDAIARLEDGYGASSATIHTTWSARNCAQTSEYRIPMKVLNAADPVKAAKLHTLNNELGTATTELNRHLQLMATAEATKAKHEQTVAQLKTDITTLGA